MDRQTEIRHRYTDKTELRHMDRQKQETDRDKTQTVQKDVLLQLELV